MIFSNGFLSCWVEMLTGCEEKRERNTSFQYKITPTGLSTSLVAHARSFDLEEADRSQVLQMPPDLPYTKVQFCFLALVSAIMRHSFDRYFEFLTKRRGCKKREKLVL
jgi:hypothetical protein